MWSTVNRILNAGFDLLLWPFQGFPAALQVLVLAIPATVVALLAFRYTSDQAGITRAKNRIKAHLLELRLFKDDFRVTMRAQGSILLGSLRYMRHGLMPMLVMIVPFLLVIVQVESRFAYEGLPPGEPVLLAVAVDGTDRVSGLDTGLVLPPGLVADTPPLRIDSSAEIYWRLSSGGPGHYPFEIRIGDDTVARQLVVGAGNGPVSPAVYRDDDWRTLAWPAEPAMEAEAAVRSVRIDYPRGRAEFGGLSSASWLLFGQCLLLGFLLRGFFNVTF